MRTIQLDVKDNGLAATMYMFTNALAEEVAAQDQAHWDAAGRKELAKVFAVLEMAVEFAHANDL